MNLKKNYQINADLLTQDNNFDSGLGRVVNKAITFKDNRGQNILGTSYILLKIMISSKCLILIFGFLQHPKYKI